MFEYTTASKRIGLLTSGGDAPGMNAVIRAVVRTAAVYNMNVLGIRRGYNGLINGDVTPLGFRDVAGLDRRGGTVLYTARCEEFKTQEGLQKAAANCRFLGIEALVTVGGDGTFRGARDLSRYGIVSVGIPATIDNDIGCSEYSIGFDTACNTAVGALDKLSDTMQSHERISVVEVMGRDAGYIASHVAVACGAAAVLIPERDTDLERDVIEKIREGRITGRNHFVIIIAEGVKRTEEVAKYIFEKTGIETRVTIIGHVQRGGSPSCHDRVVAARMGHFAVEQIANGLSESKIICMRDNNIVGLPMEEAFGLTKQFDTDLLRVSDDIGR